MSDNIISLIITILIILLFFAAAFWLVILFSRGQSKRIKEELSGAFQEIEDIVKATGGLNPVIESVPSPITHPPQSYRLFKVIFDDVNGKSYEYKVKQNLNKKGNEAGELTWNQDSSGPVIVAGPSDSKEQTINHLSNENINLRKEIEMLRNEVRNQDASG